MNDGKFTVTNDVDEQHMSNREADRRLLLVGHLGQPIWSRRVALDESLFAAPKAGQGANDRGLIRAVRDQESDAEAHTSRDREARVL